MYLTKEVQQGLRAPNRVGLLHNVPSVHDLLVPTSCKLAVSTTSVLTVGKEAGLTSLRSLFYNLGQYGDGSSDRLCGGMCLDQILICLRTGPPQLSMLARKHPCRIDCHE